jgi:membrane fusion protein, multidrug efflux system
MKAYVVAGGVVLAALVVVASTPGGTGAPRGASVPRDTGRVAVLGPSDVATAARADLVAGVPVSGTLEPAVDIRLKAPIDEVLEAVLVKEGEAVRAGQVLARFRGGVLEAQAASAEAQRRLAAADYERMRNLLAEGAVAPRDAENAEVALRAAEAVAVQARKRGEDAVVRAPLAGVIAERVVETGDRVKDGDPLFRLVNTAELEFAAMVPSEYASRVRRGAPVALAVTGGSSEPVSGRIARVNATVDAATRQVKVYVRVANAARRLVGGLFATGRVVVTQVSGAVAVPRAALRADGAGQYVLVITGGRVERRGIVTGVMDEQTGLVEVRTGLASGERVIVGPAEGISPGQRVEVAGAEG